MNNSTNNSGTTSGRACSQKQRRHSKAFRATVLAFVIATGVGLTAAWAQGPGSGPGAGPGPGKGFNIDRIERMTDRMAERLDLSDEQRAAIKTILTASRAQAEPLQTELAGARGQMRAFVTAEVFDESALRAQLEANAATLTELMVIGARTMHEVRAQLTPEQKAEAEAMMQKFRGRGYGKHGHGRRWRDD